MGIAIYLNRWQATHMLLTSLRRIPEFKDGDHLFARVSAIRTYIYKIWEDPADCSNFKVK